MTGDEGELKGFGARKRHDWIVLSIVDLEEDSLRGCRQVAHHRIWASLPPGDGGSTLSLCFVTSGLLSKGSCPSLSACLPRWLPVWSSLSYCHQLSSVHLLSVVSPKTVSSLPPYLLSDQGRCDHQLALLARLNSPVCTSTSMMPHMLPSWVVLMLGPCLFPRVVLGVPGRRCPDC